MLQVCGIYTYNWAIVLEVFVQSKLMTIFTVRHGSFLFVVLLGFACESQSQPLKFKFVAKQVEALVIIRVANLEFDAESRTRVYFAQHIASTFIVFCCDASWSQT